MAKEKEEKKVRVVAKSLDELKKGINKEHGDGSVMQGDTVISVEVFPTRVATIDRALGTGGLPCGRIVELFGMESSGKTTACLQFIAACQKHFFPKKKRNGVAAFIDAEHAFDPDWAERCGVNCKDLLFSQPDSGEEAFDIAERMAESGLVDLIVIDSVAALIPKAERDGDITDSNIGMQARLMSKGLRKLSSKVKKGSSVVCFINQVRQKIGVMFGSPDTTPGGLALKFFASIRAQVNKGSPIKGKNDVVLGFRPTLKIIKNKCAPPFTEAEFEICVGQAERPVFGIDEVSSLIEVAEEMEIVTLKGSNYYLGDQRIGAGLANATATVRKDPAVQAMLREKIYGKLQSRLAAAQAAKAAEPAETAEGEAAEVEDELEDDILDRMDHLKDSDE